MKRILENLGSWASEVRQAGDIGIGYRYCSKSYPWFIIESVLAVVNLYTL